jgi:hypothetical protein
MSEKDPREELGDDREILSNVCKSLKILRNIYR